MPGCAILVMRGSDVVYEKSFGRMEYGSQSEAIDPICIPMTWLPLPKSQQRP